MTTKFYLDQRATKKGAPAPLKLAINHKGKNAFIGTGIKLTSDQWDANKQRIINHPAKNALNNKLALFKVDVDNRIDTYAETVNMHRISACEVRIMLTSKDNGKPQLLMYYRNFMEMKNGRTHDIYLNTLKKLERYTSQRGEQTLSFDDVTRSWLEGFFTWMETRTPSVNARSIDLRNIRTVFNAAIDDGITHNYPFRKFKIRCEPTRKRNLSLDSLHLLRDYQPTSESEKYALDIFWLSFYLIGMNIADIWAVSDWSGARVEYIRAKTHKVYSIKVEPEARAIITAHTCAQGKMSWRNKYANCHNFTAGVNNRLSEICAKLDLPTITLYWARHSWATIAVNECKISKDVVSRALGHSFGNRTTDIYIAYDNKEVDIANRQMLDLLYPREN